MLYVAPTANQGSWRLLAAAFISEYALIAIQFSALLIAFKVNRKIEWLWPSIWILLPVAISIALARAKFDDEAKPTITLLKLLGCLSATYSLIHYPLIPMADPTLQARYVVLVAAWAISLLAGVACFWLPSLALLPPAFLLWSTSEASVISGLPVTTVLDITPLIEVSMCIGLGLLIDQWTRLLRFPTKPDAPQFTELLFLIAIAVHLANYFWSFLAKIQLDGSPTLWLTQNNPTGIFLTALDDNHVFFSGFPLLVEWTYWIVEHTHKLSNPIILLIQAAAGVALFFPKRALIALLVAFDMMHVAVALIAGLNFWPWIILNLIIAYVVARTDMARPIALKLMATVLIVISPRFVSVAQLGWLDSGVNNKLSFEAVDRIGNRYIVPTNFFTFYSYSFGHMDYDLPDPSIGFEVGSPNGGVYTFDMLKAARDCNVKALARQPEMFPFKPGPFERFVRNYHQLALSISDEIGAFPYDLYPHHFYVPLWVGRDFRNLNKHDIVAYIYKQETVCLSFGDGQLHRNVVASSDYRIDVSDK
jgi:hypothetical protein